MCTHATARAIKCSPDRFALFVSAEDERSCCPRLVRRATHRLFGARPIKRSLYDFTMRARRNDSNQRGILRFHARESRGGSLRMADAIWTDRSTRFPPLLAGEIRHFSLQRRARNSPGEGVIV